MKINGNNQWLLNTELLTAKTSLPAFREHVHHRVPSPTTKPPLCQECAKTGTNSPTLHRHSGHEQTADLRI
jgi:hypothetical protein